MDPFVIVTGVSTGALIAPFAFAGPEYDATLDGVHRLYIIRNGHLDPTWEEVEPRLPAIAHRAIHSLIRTQGRGDLYRLYLGAQRDGIDYHVA